MAKVDYFFCGIGNTVKVGSKNDGNQFNRRREPAFEFFKVKSVVRPRRNNHQFSAFFFFQELPRDQVGIVFLVRNQNYVAFLKIEAFGNKIYAFGGVARKNDFFSRPFAVDEAADSFPAFADLPADHFPQPVAAPAVPGRFFHTPHVPHCWDAGLLFEETTGTLFSSDLFTHTGDPPALTGGDILGPAMAAEKQFGYTGVTPRTGATIRRLADLEPRTLAIMHGSSFTGDAGAALRSLARFYDEQLRSDVPPS